MPKYDAFGREIGENTLTGLGGADFSASVAPPPEQAPPVTATVLPAGMPGGKRRNRTGLGCVMGLVVVAAVIAVPAIALFSFVGAVDDEITTVTGALDGPLDAPQPRRPAPPPSGVTGASLVREANLGKALARLRSENARTLSYIRLEAARLDTGAVRGRRQRSFQIRHDGELGSTPSRPVAAGGATIGLSAVDPGAPERLVRASAKRFGYKPGGIDYLIASGAPGGGHGWVAYFKNGHYVQGDAQGRVLRRID